MKLRAIQILLSGGLLVGVVGGTACQSSGASRQTGAVTPVYNTQTGVLEQLVASRGGDGRVDMRANMTGARVNSVEIDRNRDGHPDRWEYYETTPNPQGPGPRSRLVRAEESNGAGLKITRWEYYESGAISRVEEDTDDDGRVDKWEQYEHGGLARMDLDVAGRGFPDQRLIYRADGALDRTEVDSAGDGRFKSPEMRTGARPEAGKRE